MSSALHIGSMNPIIQSDEINNVIFVGNLSWKTTDQDLKMFFSTIGKVYFCEVKRFPDTYRSKGWGIVEFYDPRAALIAVQRYNMTEFNGRIVHVRFDRTALDEVENPHAITVFVGNIPWDANDNEIAMHFSSYPPRRLRVMQNMSGRSRGFALLHYETYDEADNAIKALNFSELRGRQIQCRIDRGPGRDAVRRPVEFDGRITLFVRNLSSAATENTLTTIFGRFGSIASTKVMIHSSGIPKGWGTVSYYTIEDAVRAVENVNGQVVFPGHPPLEVRLDRKAK